MQTGKCPKCDQTIGKPHLEPGPIGNDLTGPLAAGYTAICPRCHTVLGVLPDIDAIARAVADRLAKTRR